MWDSVQSQVAQARNIKLGTANCCPTDKLPPPLQPRPEITELTPGSILLGRFSEKSEHWLAGSAGMGKSLMPGTAARLHDSPGLPQVSTPWKLEHLDQKASWKNCALLHLHLFVKRDNRAFQYRNGSMKDNKLWNTGGFKSLQGDPQKINCHGTERK